MQYNAKSANKVILEIYKAVSSGIAIGIFDLPKILRACESALIETSDVSIATDKMLELIEIYRAN